MALFEASDYDTRIDRFRRAEGIDRAEWETDSGFTRTQFYSYLSGRCEPKSDTLSKLVRSASRILGRTVRASELYDLGEDEPLGNQRVFPYTRQHGDLRRTYETRFDAALLRHGIRPATLAREADVTRQGLKHKRMGRPARVRLIRKVVRAMRRMGRDVRASDFFDVGED